MKKKRTLIIAGAAAVVAGSLALGTVAANSTKAPGPQDQGPSALAVNPASGDKVATDNLDNVVKDVGEAAGLTDDAGNRVFSLDLKKATVASDCPARVGSFRLTPEKGHFLILDVKATLAQNAASKVPGKDDEVFMPLATQAFSVMDQHGVIDREVSSESAWGCLGDDELASPLVNPGQTVSGKIVLDVPYGSGTVVYDPDNNGGWSWPYEAASSPGS